MLNKEEERLRILQKIIATLIALILMCLIALNMYLTWEPEVPAEQAMITTKPVVSQRLSPTADPTYTTSSNTVFEDELANVPSVEIRDYEELLDAENTEKLRIALVEYFNSNATVAVYKVDKRAIYIRSVYSTARYTVSTKDWSVAITEDEEE